MTLSDGVVPAVEYDDGGDVGGELSQDVTEIVDSGNSFIYSTHRSVIPAYLLIDCSYVSAAKLWSEPML